MQGGHQGGAGQGAGPAQANRVESQMTTNPSPETGAGRGIVWSRCRAVWPPWSERLGLQPQAFIGATIQLNLNDRLHDWKGWMDSLVSALKWAAGLLTAGLLLCPSSVLAQWGGDPAQSGATVYCEAVNGGRRRDEAELAAVQVMLQLLAIGQGSLVIQQQLLPPSVQERWQALIQARCGGTGDAADGVGHDA